MTEEENENIQSSRASQKSQKKWEEKQREQRLLEKMKKANAENQQEVSVGDRFRFDKLGAYTLTLSPLFISYFPAVYVLNEDGSLQCVRERWTAKEFVQASLIQ